jgi:AraC family transcriptional regulator of adaptative response / DNA-3-methyladenine glycosylase II
VDAPIETLMDLPGIGAWTANYITMRALRWPDAFLANDLVVLKALGETRPAQALRRSEAWRPWRSYAVMHLWRNAS